MNCFSSQDPLLARRTEAFEGRWLCVDSYPIYGPLGYSSKDKSSGIKTLKSSYLQRSWLEMSRVEQATEAPYPEWAVRNWDRSND